MKLTIGTIAPSFELWSKAGSPVGAQVNMKNVWPTSPYGKGKRDESPSAIRAVRPSERKR